jgi:hypothetical protein
MSRGKRERLKKGGLFVPLIFSFGAVLEDMPLKEFLEDPTKLSNTLRTIQNYFQVDGVVCYGDTTVLAESLGCSLSNDSYPPVVDPLGELPEGFDARLMELPQAGRVATAIEVTKRLNTLLPESILLCLVPGPVTLAGQLMGLPSAEVLNRPDLLGSAGKASLTLTRALGDAGIDIVVIREETLPLLDEVTAKVLNRCYAPIWNTAKFYDLSPILMIKEFLPENIEALLKIVGDIVLPADSVPKKLPKIKRLSFSLPVSLLEKDSEEIEAFLAQKGISDAAESSRLFFVTTDNEVPKDIHKEFMIRGIQTIRDILKRTHNK